MTKRSARKNRKSTAKTAVKPASKTLVVVSYASLFFCLGSFWAIGQFPLIDNTRNGVWFVFTFLLVGLTIGVVAYSIVNRVFPELNAYKNVDEEYRRYLYGLIFGFALWTPGIAVHVNKNTVERNDANCKDFVVQNKSSARRNRGYHVFVKINGEEERLEVYKSLWDQLEPGNRIKLCIEKGALGFENIHIKPANGAN